MSRPAPVALVVGRPGVGKSALLRLLGSAGGEAGRGWSLRASLARRPPERERGVPALGVARRLLLFDAGRGRVEALLVVEGAAVPERLPEAVAERRRLGETLLLLEEAALVLHVLDGPSLGGEGGENWLHPLDAELQALGARRPAYAAVVSGIDRPWGPTGLARLRERWPGVPVFPFGPSTREGVREIRAWLRGQVTGARPRRDVR